MTELFEHGAPLMAEPQAIEKVSIIISRGSLEGVYPGLIMANGARMEGNPRKPVLHVLRLGRDQQGQARAHPGAK